MQKNRICFILCVNDDQKAKEAKYYIGRLVVPEGFEVDIIEVKEADSICSGYNYAMNTSSAKYKIYLHQDTYIINKNFLLEMLSIFSDKKIGMIGLAGCVNFPENAIQWKRYIIGKQISNNIYSTSCNSYDAFNQNKESIRVDSVDGYLMATQYDIPWREDIFKGWDFYDSSQSFEFRKKGYEVYVPFQEKPWCIHYDGFLNLKNYYRDRKIFLKEYGDMII